MKLNLTKLMAVLPALLLGVLIANGQTKQILTWRDSLDTLQKLPAAQVEEQRDEIARIRTGIEFWVRFHPNTAITLEEAPKPPLKPEQILTEAKNLRKVVDDILKEDRIQIFQLGAAEIPVIAEASALSPVSNSIDRNEILDLHATNVTRALLYLPGIELDSKADRNKAGIMIRGFDTRQIGLYLDGIPVSFPYDGYADINRFLTNDLSMIEVAKGYASPLLGPSGLGGAINLVTRQPEKHVEGDVLFGTGSGHRIESGVHLGSRLDKFYIRGGMDWLQTSNYPLSGHFKANALQPTYQRAGADKQDASYNGRIGYVPKGEDQYVFTYYKQKAENNVPSYAGNNGANNTVNYWSYPYWNSDSYYFNSNTGLGEKSAIKFRAFYDKYPKGLNTFSDAAHKIMTGFTPYDDYSAGGSSEFTTRMISRNALSGSFFLKDDTHKEHSFSYSSGKTILNTPWILDRDRYLSFGVQDVLNLMHGVRATVGISVDHLKGSMAQDPNSSTRIAPFACTTSTTTGPCQLADKWTYNPLASISYSVVKAGTIFFSFSQKSLFPTLKDRYVYTSLLTIPNPSLAPEHARNYNLGYSHAFAAKNTTIQVEAFRSDVYDAIENAIVPAQFANQCKSFSSVNCQQSVNVGNEIHKGAEFTIRTSPLRRLNLVGNYTFLERNINAPAIAPGVVSVPKLFPTGIPKHKAVTTASWRLPHEVLMLATARFESGIYTLDNKGKVFPASTKFVMVDWEMTIPITHIASLQGGIKNLLDRNYYYQEGYPEAGRNFYTNLRFRF